MQSANLTIFSLEREEPERSLKFGYKKAPNESGQVLFSRMGFGKVKQLGDAMIAVELQAEAMAEVKNGTKDTTMSICRKIK